MEHAAARHLWSICFGATAVISVVAIGVGFLAIDPVWVELQEMAFYAAAIVNLGALLRALFVQDRLRRSLLREVDSDRREGLVYEAARQSALPLTYAGLLASIAVATTAGWGPVLMLLPIFVFALVFRPGSRWAASLVAPPPHPIVKPESSGKD